MLFDRIVQNGFVTGRDVDAQTHGALMRHAEHIHESTVIDITNVADYFWTSWTSGQHHWRITDFPNLAPPLPNIFFEYRSPFGSKRGRIGVYFNMGDVGTVPITLFGNPSFEAACAGTIRWIGQALVFMDHQDGGVELLLTLEIFVNEDGRPHAGSHFTGQPIANMATDPLVDSPRTAFEATVRLLVYPCFLALSFLHCKNVTTRDVVPSSRLNRTREREGKRPLTRYHVLEIEPMKRVLRHEGQSEVGGLHRALHICRGHFATYTEDRPLFGKVAGTFWHPMHTRGRREQGVVTKDYLVKRPALPVTS